MRSFSTQGNLGHGVGRGKRVNSPCNMGGREEATVAKGQQAGWLAGEKCERGESCLDQENCCKSLFYR
jgi:hypothetical protein